MEPNKKELDNVLVPVSQLRKITEKTKLLAPDAKISLEFVLMALFPTVWNNVMKYGNDCYTQGYIQGLNDGKELKEDEDKGNN